MVMALLAIFIGLAVLVWSAERFVQGAAATARHLDLPPLLIGMLVVGFGTSAPEMAVSAFAALQGNPALALGNAYGSNLFNTLVVVGLAAVIHPMTVAPEVFSRDLLVMSILTLMLFLFSYGRRGPGRINRLEGAILLACFGGYTAYLIAGVVG